METITLGDKHKGGPPIDDGKFSAGLKKELDSMWKPYAYGFAHAGRRPFEVVRNIFGSAERADELLASKVNEKLDFLSEKGLWPEGLRIQRGPWKWGRKALDTFLDADLMKVPKEWTPDTLAEEIASGLVEATGEIATLIALPGGIASKMAFLGITDTGAQKDTSALDIAIAGAEGALFGRALKAVGAYPKAEHMAALAGLFGLQAYIKTGSPREAVKAGAIGLGLGFTGGSKQGLDFKARRKLMRQIREREKALKKMSKQKKELGDLFKDMDIDLTTDQLLEEQYNRISDRELDIKAEKAAEEMRVSPPWMQPRQSLKVFQADKRMGEYPIAMKGYESPVELKLDKDSLADLNRETRKLEKLRPKEMEERWIKKDGETVSITKKSERDAPVEYTTIAKVPGVARREKDADVPLVDAKGNRVVFETIGIRQKEPKGLEEVSERQQLDKLVLTDPKKAAEIKEKYGVDVPVIAESSGEVLRQAYGIEQRKSITEKPWSTFVSESAESKSPVRELDLFDINKKGSKWIVKNKASGKTLASADSLNNAIGQGIRSLRKQEAGELSVGSRVQTSKGLGEVTNIKEGKIWLRLDKENKLVSVKPEEVKIDSRFSKEPNEITLNAMGFQGVYEVAEKAFKKWFGKSKVADKRGNPLVVYHGRFSKKPYDKFENIREVSYYDQGGMRFRPDVPPTKTLRGAWFTTSPKYAEQIGRPNTRAFYIRMERPFDMRSLGEDPLGAEVDAFYKKHKIPFDSVREGRTPVYDEPKGGYGPEYVKEIYPDAGHYVSRMDILKKLGYDGVILREGNADTYIVFDNNQIKAINNRGTWSRDSDILLESMGFQSIYESISKRLAKRRDRKANIKPTQLDDPLAPYTKAGKVVKQRKGSGGRVFPPVYKDVRDAIMKKGQDLPISLTTKNLWLTGPRAFDILGSDFKAIFYDTVKDGEHYRNTERLKWTNEIRKLQKGMSVKSRKNIVLFAISKQQGVANRLVHMEKEARDKLLAKLQQKAKKKGQEIPKSLTHEQMAKTSIKVPQELSPKEQIVYDKMQQWLEEFYVRLNAARIKAGRHPFPKVKNYFTFMYKFGFLTRLGINPVESPTKDPNNPNAVDRVVDKIMQQPLDARMIKMGITPFRFAKKRGLEGLKTEVGYVPLELDPFKIGHQYINSALDHIHLGPRIAFLRELLGDFDVPNPKTGQMQRWTLANSRPRAAGWLNRWLNHQAGMKIELPTGPVIDMLAAGLSRNLTYAVLSANLRSAWIQWTAIGPSMIEVGPHNIAKGLDILVSPKKREHALRSSRVLVGRVYDVAAQDVVDAVRTLVLTKARSSVAKAGLWPLQFLDMQTALVTWQGAYIKAESMKGKNGKAFTETQKVRYADSVVNRTQASAAKSDVSQIQYFPLGKTATLFQTFVINHWNWLAGDVLGVKNENITRKQTVVKGLGYLTMIAIMEYLYEDVFGIPSPYPGVIHGYKEKLDETDDHFAATRMALKEAAEIIPQFGGGIRYGSSVLGAPAEFLFEAGKYFTDYPIKEDPYVLIGKGAGVPGTVQAHKMSKAIKRGESPYGIAMGQYSDKTKKAKGLKGLDELETVTLGTLR